MERSLRDSVKAAAPRSPAPALGPSAAPGETHRNLDAEGAAGRFRADLLFRLEVIEIRLPPLREREGDVARLTRGFVDRFCQEHAARARRVHPAAMVALTAYAWPGNVRELRNVLERAVVLAPGDEVTLDLLPPEVAGSAPNLPESHGLKQAVRAFKERVVDRALADTGGDHGAAARLREREGPDRAALTRWQSRRGCGRWAGSRRGSGCKHR